MENKTTETKLVIGVSVCDEYYEDDLFGVVTITPEEAKKYLGYIKTLQKLQKQDSNISSIIIHNYKMDFFIMPEDDEHSSIFDELIDGSDELYEVNINTDKYEYEKTEVNSIHIYDDYFLWVAYIKHTNIEILSQPISIENLEKIIAKG